MFGRASDGTFTTGIVRQEDIFLRTFIYLRRSSTRVELYPRRIPTRLSIPEKRCLVRQAAFSTHVCSNVLSIGTQERVAWAVQRSAFPSLSNLIGLNTHVCSFITPSSTLSPIPKVTSTTEPLCSTLLPGRTNRCGNTSPSSSETYISHSVQTTVILDGSRQM